MLSCTFSQKLSFFSEFPKNLYFSTKPDRNSHSVKILLRNTLRIIDICYAVKQFFKVHYFLKKTPFISVFRPNGWKLNQWFKFFWKQPWDDVCFSFSVWFFLISKFLLIPWFRPRILYEGGPPQMSYRNRNPGGADVIDLILLREI